MNSIDTLIALANLRGSLDVRCQFQGDWALDHAPGNLGVAPYHIVLSGTCRAELSGGQQVVLGPGFKPMNFVEVIRTSPWIA